MSTKALLVNSLLACAVAYPVSQEIQWGECEFNSEHPIECATLSVPLDYSEPSSTETLPLELLKIPASKSPSKGSVLVNFGGPGDATRETLANRGGLDDLGGGYYDLIAFDPRGTGKSLNYPSSMDEAAEQIAVDKAGADAANAPLDPLRRNVWKLGGVAAQICQSSNADRAAFVGTTFVARDMMHIVDALGGDRLLRYMGFSYGTVLGATVASMFPDRMDRVILDGVSNPLEHFHTHGEEAYDSTDETLTRFLSACVEAGPAACALAHGYTSAATLKSEISALIEKLKAGDFHQYISIRGSIFKSLYNTDAFLRFAPQLASLLANKPDAAPDTANKEETAEPVFKNPEALLRILCSDKGADVSASAAPERNGFEQKVLPTLKKLDAVSKVAADVPGFFRVAVCTQWHTPAKRLYTGNFRVKTRHPVLVIGNTYDPVTPLVSARNVSVGLEGSVLLENRATGHGSSAQFSRCTFEAARDYMVDGTLPEPGTVCEPDKSLADIFKDS